MTDVYIPDYGLAPVPARSGQVLIARKKWPITVQANADRVFFGDLPAGCLFCPELTAVVADANNPGFEYSLCLGGNTQLAITDQSVTASTFTKTHATASISDPLVEALGVSESNVQVYLILVTAPTAIGAASVQSYVLLNLAYYAANY